MTAVTGPPAKARFLCKLMWVPLLARRSRPSQQSPEKYGVMSMPALVVNEKVVAMGKVLKAADVVALLHKLGF